MDFQIATDWANLLDSGKYPQGRGSLCRDGKFCCLGVLNEMAVEAGIVTKTPPAYEGEEVLYTDVEPSVGGCGCGWHDKPSRNHSTGILTRNVQAWAGMRDSNGTFLDNARLGNHVALTAANDEGVSFSVIAQFIRENYETL